MQKYPSPSEEPRIRMVELRLAAAEPMALYRVLGPKDVAHLLRELVGDADREHFVAVYLDAAHQATHVHTVSVGTLNSTLVHPREVFKGALLANSQALVVGHNHPSGTVTPSKEDRSVHDKLTQAGELLGIRLLDSIIVGPTPAFYSFADDSEATFAA